jgi:hypothetical protein
MNLVRTAKRKATALIAPALFMAMTGYFCWNATRGDHGLKTFALRRTQLVAYGGGARPVGSAGRRAARQACGPGHAG